MKLDQEFVKDIGNVIEHRAGEVVAAESPYRKAQEVAVKIAAMVEGRLTQTGEPLTLSVEGDGQLDQSNVYVLRDGQMVGRLAGVTRCAVVIGNARRYPRLKLTVSTPRTRLGLERE